MSETKNLLNEFPWVIAERRTYDIISAGTFQGLSQGATSERGHLMTYRTWKQIVEERNLSPKKDLVEILETLNQHTES